MKDSKLTREDFPLRDVVMTVDASGKTGFNGSFVIQYMQRETTMYKTKAPVYSGEPLSGYMDRSQDSPAGEVKIKGMSHASQLDPITAPAKYDPADVKSTEETTGVNVMDQLKSMLIQELVQTVTKRALNMLFTFGEETRRRERGWLERLLSQFNKKYVKTHVVNSHKDLMRVLVVMKNGIMRRSGMHPDYVVTNVRVAALLADMSGYSISAGETNVGQVGAVFPSGQVCGLRVFVDPHMTWNDCRLLMGASTKNNLDGLYVVFDPNSLSFYESKLPPENGREQCKLDAKMDAKVTLLRMSSEMKECCVSYLTISKNIL